MSNKASRCGSCIPYVIDCTYGAVIEHNFAILLADRSRLQLTSGLLIVRFRRDGDVLDVADAFVKHLQCTKL